MNNFGSASPGGTKMSRRRGRTTGWAAFDLEQRRNLGHESQKTNDESFPPISGLSLRNSESTTILEKPFVSALNSLNFPTVRDESNIGKKQLQFSSTSNYSRSAQCVNKSIEDITTIKTLEMLRDSHPWADERLIDDVMAGVDNDVNKASELLKAMVCSEKNCKENKDLDSKDITSGLEDSFRDKNRLPATMTADPVKLSSLLEKSFNFLNEESTKGHDPELKMVLNSLKDIPIEPEWEEDDLYLLHRKEALRMMRSASRHSKAANDAYFREDHLSARQYSLKAREDWMEAEKLNASAAHKILGIRNAKNDQWTLDLHGLHGVEAVKALQEHLWKIESHLSTNQLGCINGVKKGADVILPASFHSASHTDSENLGRQRPYSRLNPVALQVITGKGNHSRGEAALPAAIRSFLIENGYQYDETRPGVITVRPKFRGRLPV